MGVPIRVSPVGVPAFDVGGFLMPRSGLPHSPSERGKAFWGRKTKEPGSLWEQQNPFRERVPRAAHMVPPYFHGAEFVFCLDLPHFHSFRGYTVQPSSLGVG